MKIVIAYLYYDLLNLYGESGNIKIIKDQLKKQGINSEIKLLSIEDNLKFDEYDLTIISAGTENNQRIVLNHLKHYKKDIKNAIKNNKFFLITGNAIDLFGRYIIDINNKKIKTLNVFNYIVKENNRRIVNDSLFLSKETNDYIIGFQNQCRTLIHNKYPMFEVVKGFGASENSNEEGIHYKNFYGTYLIGPLLVRNPKFTLEFLKNLIKSINPTFKFKEFDFNFEIEAYDSYFNLHYNKIPKIKSTTNV